MPIPRAAMGPPWVGGYGFDLGRRIRAFSCSALCVKTHLANFATIVALFLCIIIIFYHNPWRQRRWWTDSALHVALDQSTGCEGTRIGTWKPTHTSECCSLVRAATKQKLQRELPSFVGYLYTNELERISRQARKLVSGAMFRRMCAKHPGSYSTTSFTWVIMQRLLGLGL